MRMEHKIENTHMTEHKKNEKPMHGKNQKKEEKMLTRKTHMNKERNNY